MIFDYRKTTVLLSLLVMLSFAIYIPVNTEHDTYIENSFITDAYAQQQLGNINNTDKDAVKNNLSSAKNSDNIEDDALSKLYDKVDQSVIQVTQNSNIPSDTRLGSGFVYDKEGHIVANYHVVAGENTEEEYDITFTDGSAYKATVVGLDPFAEIAVLKIVSENNTQVNEKLVPLQIGNFSQVKVGQRVVAIGNPYGLSASITEGIVSGLGRLLPTLPSQTGQTPTIENIPAFSIPNIIQTDAAINPGNSGGPLLNMRGEVIGINTAIFSVTGAYSGIGFAIPSYLIEKIVPSLIATGTYGHPWLGIEGTDITADIAEYMNLQNTTGFLVTQVTSGSPADSANIKGGHILTVINGREIELGGDVIIAVDDKPIRKIDDLLSFLEREKETGDNVTLSLIRNGTMQKIDLTLASRPTTAFDGEIRGNPQEKRPTLGITGIDVTPELATEMDMPQRIIDRGEGFLVVDIIRNGPADKAGIRGGYIASNINGTKIELGGDIIIGIDNQTVKSSYDIRNYLSSKQIGDIVQLAIYRDNKTMSIPVMLEASSEQDLTNNPVPKAPFAVPDEPSPYLPFNPFDDFGDSRMYDQCVQSIDKIICDRLFGRQ